MNCNPKNPVEQAAVSASTVIPVVGEDTSWTHDALHYGSALNAAAWVFVERCPEKSALLFNSVKEVLRAAILSYAEGVSAAAPEAFVTVPVEPTEAQVAEGERQVQAVLDAIGKNARAQTLALVAYDGMVAARPTHVTLATVKPKRGPTVPSDQRPR